MSVNLQKGQRVSLSKDREGLSKIMVGLGWDAAEVKKHGLFGFGGGSTHNIDCDASVILLKNGRLESSKDVVYFGNLKHASGAVKHMGDNLTGDGDGDDEQIMIDLSKLPPEYDRLVITVNIYQAAQRQSWRTAPKYPHERWVHHKRFAKVRRPHRHQLGKCANGQSFHDLVPRALGQQPLQRRREPPSLPLRLQVLPSSWLRTTHRSSDPD